MPVKWLREKGILKAQKKQDRETNEGVISFYNHETSLNSFYVKLSVKQILLQKMMISYHLLIY